MHLSTQESVLLGQRSDNMKKETLQLTEQHFKPLKREEQNAELIARPSISFWQDAWRRLKKNPVAITSLVYLIVIILLALVAPELSKYGDITLDTANKNLPPSSEHWFGTDDFGRDLWVRVWEGARISLLIAFVAVAIDLTVGLLLGGLAGYFGGKIDMIIMRIIEILVGIPYLILVILLMIVLGQGIGPMILALIITGWVNMARLIRGQIMQLKNQEFILAAKTLGAPLNRIVFKHLVPNILPIIIVWLTMNIPQVIFAEAFLSFIGIGLEPPIASWGVLINEGFRLIRLFSWNFWFPALAISLTTLAFNLLGDGLRDAIDPKLRK